MNSMRKRKAVGKRDSKLYINNSVAQRLAEQKTGRPVNRARVDALIARIGALPVLDPRKPDEILGYDDFGVPR